MTPMTRIQTVLQLLNILHNANMAGCKVETMVGGEVEYNDFSPINSSQTDLFGNIADAIESLGYKWAYEDYCETGEIPIVLTMCSGA